MSVKLLTEHNFEFLSLKGSCTGSSESTLVKMPHCLKSHATAHMFFEILETYHKIVFESALTTVSQEWNSKWFSTLQFKKSYALESLSNAKQR